MEELQSAKFVMMRLEDSINFLLIDQDKMANTSLDLFGRFIDQQLQEEFVLYCLDQRSKITLATMTFIILAWSLFETFTILNDENPTDDLIFSTISIIMTIIGFILVSILTFSPLKLENQFFYSYCQTFLLICLNFLFMIKAIRRILIGTNFCIPEAYNSTKLVLKYLSSEVSDADVETLHRILGYVHLPSSCSPDNSYYYLANITTIKIMSMVFQILTAVISEPRLSLLWTCYLPTVGLILFMDYSSFFSLIPLVVGFVAVVFLHGELHYQRAQSFLSQKKIQQLLEENERTADASNAMEMRHMISNVAHDLKTPLSSFTNGLDTIRDIIVSASKKMAEEKYLESNPEIFAETCASIHSCLTNIRNTNAFMLMAINRCLDYTKASKGMKLVPTYETVDLREALKFPVECMSNIQERIGIKLGALSEEICSHIITDKHWLQENLLCLLSNAVKYSTEGNVTITVTRTTSISKPAACRLSKTFSSLFGKQSSNITNKIVPTVLTNDSEHEIEECFLLFEIEDTGIGISEEKAKNLFNPFKQAQRLAGGTGLGLYSLAKRIEALKGDYGVRKRKDMDKGSLFWFTLPYKPDTASAASKEILFDQPFSCDNKQSFSSNSLYTNANDVLTILLVDDAPSILKLSAMMLKRQGYQIWTAENGETALNRIEEKWKNTGKGFDIVLMDLQMPVMDGLEATRRLRQMEEEGRDWMRSGDNIVKEFTPHNGMRCHQIIIGLSANSDHETVVEAFNAGVDDFIGKPFSLTTFNTMVERFFR